MHEINELWLNTAQAALSVVAEPLVNERWTSDSCLPDMTVGALSGHLLHSGILLVEAALNAADVHDVSPLSAATLFSLVPLEEADPTHADVRSVAEGQSNDGQSDLVARATTSLNRIQEALDRTPMEGVVAFLELAIPMTLEELLGSRILELVVHLDDLTCSVGMTKFPVATEAVVLTCHQGLDIDMKRYGPEEVLRALFRRDRAERDALRPF
jgi:hypothetical protein